MAETKQNSVFTNFLVIVFLVIFYLPAIIFVFKPDYLKGNQFDFINYISLLFLIPTVIVLFLLFIANYVAKQTNFISNIEQGSKHIKTLLKSIGDIFSDFNSLFNWKKLREVFVFSLFFGIISNIFFPQVLKIGFRDFRPFAWLLFDTNNPPMAFRLKDLYDREVYIKMVESGTINTIVTYTFWIIVIFIGGSKVLYLLSNGGYKKLIELIKK